MTAHPAHDGARNSTRWQTIKIGARLRVSGIELQGSAEVLASLRRHAAAGLEDAEVVPSIGIVRVEGKRCLLFRDRFVQLARRSQSL